MTDTRKTMQQALEAMELARRSHGTMLLSDPPQDAWKTNRVDSALFNAIEALREALAQQGEQPDYNICPSCGGMSSDPCVPIEARLPQQWEQQPDVLAEYTRTDGHRQWESVGAWLYPGDKIAVISAGAAPAAQPDTWTDDGGWTFPVERQIIQTR